MLKKLRTGKIDITKIPLFFLLRVPTHHGINLNSRFLYELKQKVCLFKTVCGIFSFRFRFIFIKVYVFVQQKAWAL